MTAAICSEFISLGDNCEVGLVQRNNGYEPFSVFSFSMTPIDGVSLALEERFARLTDPAYIVAVEAGEGESQEYMLRNSRYGLEQHSFIHPSRMAQDEFLRKQASKLDFLAENLLDDLREGSKICVVKQNGNIPAAKVHRLRLAIASLGSCPLLYVMVVDDPQLVGTVSKEDASFFSGHIDRLARYDLATDMSYSCWMEILSRTVELRGKA